MELLSSTSRVQAPIIMAKIGDVSFSLYNRTKKHIEEFGRYYQNIKVSYPNYLQSLTVTKINGALNTYVLTLEYPITDKDDPNLIDKILSKVSKSRQIILTYGDATIPNYLYREEVALITQVRTNPDVLNSKITYTINAVSTALKANAGTRTFPRRLHTKPSTVIKELLRDKSKGLCDIFYGMHNYQTVLQQGVIASDDVPVDIMEKDNISTLDYLKYLVECMAPSGDDTSVIGRTGAYVLTLHDDISEVFDGPYFAVSKIVSGVPDKTSLNTYEVDIGFPSKDYVSRFAINNDQTYSILFDYANDLEFSDFIYRINDAGETVAEQSPIVGKSSTYLQATIANKNWWSKMTQFPIKASLEVRGLLRAIILMSYIKINVYFYGKKHTASGVYCVTKQVDTISSNGYFTTLDLLRVQGDEI